MKKRKTNPKVQNVLLLIACIVLFLILGSLLFFSIELANDDYTAIAAKILEGCGGKENITSIDNCITRLRLEVKDITAVNDKVIKSAGVAGVIKPGKTSVQVIIGTKVQFVADAFSELCK